MQRHLCFALARPLEQGPPREQVVRESKVPAAELAEQERPVPAAFPLAGLEALVPERARAPEQRAELVLQLERRRLVPH